jgi:putative ABC transport system ATP-binding protein
MPYPRHGTIRRMAISVVAGRDLTKRYGEGDAAVNALRGVSLDIAPGTFTAIMGPSGSGKSTLMHVLAGLDRPTEGTVDIDGTEIGKLDDGDLTRLRRDKIGFVFQAFNLVPVLTAEENVRLPLTLAGRDDKGDRVAQLLEAVALTDRRTHRPAELSGGQQQRVAVARALASEPAVIFADEPTGNLDSSTSGEILDLLRRAVDEFGQAVVMVTHEAAAAAIADRVIFLDDGQVVADDSDLDADQILDRMKALA